MLTQEKLMHPVLLTDELDLSNGGLRIRVAIEKGYDGIDSFVTHDRGLLNKLTIIQQADAQNYIPFDDLEVNELIHVKDVDQSYIHDLIHK